MRWLLPLLQFLLLLRVPLLQLLRLLLVFLLHLLLACVVGLLLLQSLVFLILLLLQLLAFLVLPGAQMLLLLLMFLINLSVAGGGSCVSLSRRKFLRMHGCVSVFRATFRSRWSLVTSAFSGGSSFPALEFSGA